MKTSTLVSSLVLSLNIACFADSSVVLTGVHNCCKKCENGIIDAVSKVEGASATAEKSKVTITAKDDAAVKRAVASLVSNGYFAKEAEAPVIADAKVKSVTVSGVHLCCQKCVTAVENAVTSVGGVSGHDATKGAKSFKVEGDFSTKELAAALNNNGFNGEIK